MMLGLGLPVLAACGRRERYFGRSTPPSTQALVYEIPAEPTGFDPATSIGGAEQYVLPALSEGLFSCNPETLEPQAGLATHYHVHAKLMEYTFFLRGHPNPRGTKLAGAGIEQKPALWSDGRPVTADDVVYAWRRIADPALGSVFAVNLFMVANAQEIAEGKAGPETLGVRSVDDFTLHVTLRAPAAHFLRVAATQGLAPVPRHAIQIHGALWATPGRIISSGPFQLHEWKPYDRIVVRKNPRYHAADRVFLQEIVFIPVTDSATGVNLYKTGSVHAMHGRAIPPLWIPALRGRTDFHSAPAYRSLFYAFNTRRPPFDNVLVRYAFAMATDKREITRFLDGGQTPARTLVPPFGGYQGINTLPVEAGGRVWDVLSYDPEAARELLRLSAQDHLITHLTFPNRSRSKEMAQILQKQWRERLGVQINLVMMDWNVWVQTVWSGAYRGLIECGFGADYPDPTSFFDGFNGRDDGSGWNDPEVRRQVDHANTESDPAARMRKLAACEAHLLRWMPLLPMFFDTYCYLQKPYVTGMKLNLLDAPEFKGVGIDTNWRPS
jgi:oligopeptide transport system substrate-binding protein